MTNIEIEAEIRRLQRKLRGYQSSKRKAENEQKDLEDIIAKIHAKGNEIESGLQETMRNIEKKVARINQKSKFRTRYLTNAKNILFNSNSSSALEKTRDAERKAKNKYFDLDDDIAVYRNKISDVEIQINALKQQLK